MKKFPWMVVALVLSSGLAGCGTAAKSGALSLPFTNETGQEVVQPNPSFNTYPGDPAVYNQFSVVNDSGQTVTLHANQQPILFEAYWCAHCQRTLLDLNKNKGVLKQLPVIVSLGFLPGTTLQQAVSITHQESDTFHLEGFQFYYILDPQAGVKYAKHGYPTLAFPAQGNVFTIAGEHTFAVWQKAINQG